jgi:hypothetical protein
MPTYRITAPSGRSWDIESDRELTHEEQIAAVQQEIRAQAQREVEASRPADPAEGMSRAERLYAGYQAGVGSAMRGLAQAALPKFVERQLSKLSDEAIEQDRRDRAALAAKDPYLGKTAGIVGQIVPTLPALAISGGASTPAVIGSGAAQGAVAGLTEPTTSSESAVAPVALGAGLGAALPVAGYAARGLWRTGKQIVSPTAAAQAAPERAAKRLIRTIGPKQAKEVAVQAAVPPSGPAGAIPQTLAQRTGNLSVAAMERGANARAPELAGEFARRQNEATVAAIDEITRNRAQEAARREARAELTAPMREAALKSAARWKHVSEPLNTLADDLMRTTGAGTPERAVVQEFRKVLREESNPEQLYSFMRTLETAGNQPPGSANRLVSSAQAADDAVTMQIRQAIRDRLDEASDGLFGQYMNAYSQASKPVDEAKAMRAIWEYIDNPQLAREGAVADVTPSVLRKAMAQKGVTHPKWGSRLGPQAEQEMGQVTDVLRKNEEVQRTLKTAGTSGGDSGTVMNAGLAYLRGVATRAGSATRLTPLLRSIGNKLDQQGVEDFVRFTQNPTAAAAEIRRQLERGVGLTPAQQAFMALSSRAAAEASVSPRR